MCLVNVVLWSLDHADDLGLRDGEVGHEWFRRSLGAAHRLVRVRPDRQPRGRHGGPPGRAAGHRLRPRPCGRWRRPGRWSGSCTSTSGPTGSAVLAAPRAAVQRRDVHAPARLAGPRRDHPGPGDRPEPAGRPVLRPGPPRDGRRGPRPRPAPLALRGRLGRPRPPAQARSGAPEAGGRAGSSSRSDLGRGKWTLSSRTHSSTIVAPNRPWR